MPNLTIDLADGRRVRFEDAPRPPNGEPPHGPIHDIIVGAQVEGFEGHMLRPTKGPDLVAVDENDPSNVLVIEVKGDIRKITPGLFSDERIQRDLAGWLSERHIDGRQLRVTKELWRPDLAGHALWVYTLDSAGQRIDPPKYYRIEAVTMLPQSTDDTSISVQHAEGQEINTAYLTRRVDDWENRIRTLYDDIREWLRGADTEKYQLDTNEVVTMHEELMQRFAVPARKLPVLTVIAAGHRILTFKPYALWIIAGNGRIDVIGGGGAFLVDRARHFQPPQWEMFFIGERRFSGRRIRQGRAFNANALGDLIAEI